MIRIDAPGLAVVRPRVVDAGEAVEVQAALDVVQAP